ncbi:MAG TPA: hypothetical protein VF951_02040, partial [Streptosporangiaceae bacterium]
MTSGAEEHSGTIGANGARTGSNGVGGSSGAGSSGVGSSGPSSLAVEGLVAGYGGVTALDGVTLSA